MIKIKKEWGVFKDNWMEVRVCEVEIEGKKKLWSYIIGDDAVAGVVVDKKHNVYLIKEWRLAWKREIITLPIGRIEKKLGMKKTLLKELKEEIGIVGRKIEKIATILLGHRMRTYIHIFLVRDLKKVKRTPEEGEEIEIIKIPLKKAVEMVEKGRIRTTPDTFLGLLLAKNKLKI